MENVDMLYRMSNGTDKRLTNERERAPKIIYSSTTDSQGSPLQSTLSPSTSFSSMDSGFIHGGSSPTPAHEDFMPNDPEPTMLPETSTPILTRTSILRTSSQRVSAMNYNKQQQVLDRKDSVRFKLSLPKPPRDISSSDTDSDSNTGSYTINTNIPTDKTKRKRKSKETDQDSDWKPVVTKLKDTKQSVRHKIKPGYVSQMKKIFSSQEDIRLIDNDINVRKSNLKRHNSVHDVSNKYLSVVKTTDTPPQRTHSLSKIDDRKEFTVLKKTFNKNTDNGPFRSSASQNKNYQKHPSLNKKNTPLPDKHLENQSDEETNNDKTPINRNQPSRKPVTRKRAEIPQKTEKPKSSEILHFRRVGSERVPSNIERDHDKNFVRTGSLTSGLKDFLRKNYPSEENVPKEDVLSESNIDKDVETLKVENLISRFGSKCNMLNDKRTQSNVEKNQQKGLTKSRLPRQMYSGKKFNTLQGRVDNDTSDSKNIEETATQKTSKIENHHYERVFNSPSVTRQIRTDRINSDCDAVNERLDSSEFKQQPEDCFTQLHSPREININQSENINLNPDICVQSQTVRKDECTNFRRSGSERVASSSVHSSSRIPVRRVESVRSQNSAEALKSFLRKRYPSQEDVINETSHQNLVHKTVNNGQEKSEIDRLIFKFGLGTHSESDWDKKTKSKIEEHKGRITQPLYTARQMDPRQIQCPTPILETPPISSIEDKGDILIKENVYDIPQSPDYKKVTDHNSISKHSSLLKHENVSRNLKVNLSSSGYIESSNLDTFTKLKCSESMPEQATQSSDGVQNTKENDMHKPKSPDYKYNKTFDFLGNNNNFSSDPSKPSLYADNKNASNFYVESKTSNFRDDVDFISPIEEESNMLDEEIISLTTSVQYKNTTNTDKESADEGRKDFNIHTQPPLNVVENIIEQEYDREPTPIITERSCCNKCSNMNENSQKDNFQETESYQQPKIISTHVRSSSIKTENHSPSFSDHHQQTHDHEVTSDNDSHTQDLNMSVIQDGVIDQFVSAEDLVTNFTHDTEISVDIDNSISKRTPPKKPPRKKKSNPGFNTISSELDHISREKFVSTADIETTEHTGHCDNLNEETTNKLVNFDISVDCRDIDNKLRTDSHNRFIPLENTTRYADDNGFQHSEIDSDTFENKYTSHISDTAKNKHMPNTQKRKAPPAPLHSRNGDKNEAIFIDTDDVISLNNDTNQDDFLSSNFYGDSQDISSNNDDNEYEHLHTNDVESQTNETIITENEDALDSKHNVTSNIHHDETQQSQYTQNELDQNCNSTFPKKIDNSNLHSISEEENISNEQKQHLINVPSNAIEIKIRPSEKDEQSKSVESTDNANPNEMSSLDEALRSTEQQLCQTYLDLMDTWLAKRSHGTSETDVDDWETVRSKLKINTFFKTSAGGNIDSSSNTDDDGSSSEGEYVVETTFGRENDDIGTQFEKAKFTRSCDFPQYDENGDEIINNMSVINEDERDHIYAGSEKVDDNGDDIIENIEKFTSEELLVNSDDTPGNAMGDNKNIEFPDDLKSALKLNLDFLQETEDEEIYDISQPGLLEVTNKTDSLLVNENVDKVNKHIADHNNTNTKHKPRRFVTFEVSTADDIKSTHACHTSGIECNDDDHVTDTTGKTLTPLNPHQLNKDVVFSTSADVQQEDLNFGDSACVDNKDSKIAIIQEISNSAMPEKSSGNTKTSQMSEYKGGKKITTKTTTSVNGGGYDDEQAEQKRHLALLSESIAKLNGENNDDIIPEINQTITKLNGGNLVITTLTHRVVEEEDEDKVDSSLVPVGSSNKNAYIVQDHKGDTYMIEDITDDTQESAYYSSSDRRYNSEYESMSSGSGSPQYQKIHNLRAHGHSGVDYDTAEEVILSLYNPNSMEYIETDERSYSGQYNDERLRQGQGQLLPYGYTDSSTNKQVTSYEYEKDGSPKKPDHYGSSSLKTVKQSYEMSSDGPWVTDGKNGYVGSQDVNMKKEVTNQLSNYNNNGMNAMSAAYMVEANSSVPQINPYFVQQPLILPQLPLMPQYNFLQLEPLPKKVTTGVQVTTEPVKITEKKEEVKIVTGPDETDSKRVQERPVYKSVALVKGPYDSPKWHTAKKHKPYEPPEDEVDSGKKYKVVKSSASDDVKEETMEYTESTKTYTTVKTENMETSGGRYLDQNRNVSTIDVGRNRPVTLNGNGEFIEPRYISERTFSVGKQPTSDARKFRSTIEVNGNSFSGSKQKSYDQMDGFQSRLGEILNHQQTTYQETPEPERKRYTDVDRDMKVVRGNILIKNNFDEGLDEFNDNINVFDNQFSLSKQNPLYNSDEDIYKRYEDEKRRQQERDMREMENMAFETVDRFSKSKNVTRTADGERRRPPRSKQNLTNLLLSRLSTMDSKDIRQTIDVKHHHEDIYGDPALSQADGTSSRRITSANYDTVSENVDLTMKDGKAFITITVTAERLTPVDYEFHVWRKNQAIVTRVVEIDFYADEQRRLLYDRVMDRVEDEGYSNNRKYSHYTRRKPQEIVLSSQDTLDLFNELMDAAGGEGDKEDITVKTKRNKTVLPENPFLY